MQLIHLRHVYMTLRYASVIWLLFLIGHLYLIGVYLGDYQRTKTIKTHGSMRLIHVSKFYYLLHTQ